MEVPLSFPDTCSKLLQSMGIYPSSLIRSLSERIWTSLGSSRGYILTQTLRELPVSRIPTCRKVLKPVEASKKATTAGKVVSRETETKKRSKRSLRLQRLRLSLRSGRAKKNTARKKEKSRPA